MRYEMRPEMEVLLAGVSGFGDYGAFGFSFKKLVKKATSVVTKPISVVAKPVVQATKWTGRQVDVTSSKSLLGSVPYVGQTAVGLARQAVATAKIGTGVTAIQAAAGYAASKAGMSSIGNKLMAATVNDVVEGAKGYATGAAIGGAILSGGSLLDAAASVLPSASPAQAAVAASAAPEPVAVAPAAPASSGGLLAALGPLAGVGAGLLLAGPIGALVGGAAGFFATKKG